MRLLVPLVSLIFVASRAMAAPSVTLQHDDGTPAYVLNIPADGVELVKFCPEGMGTITAIRVNVNGTGLPATCEVHVWANFGGYDVDWDRDLSGPLTWSATRAGWNSVPLPAAGLRFDTPPCFWIGFVHRGNVDPSLVVDTGQCLGDGPGCTTSFVDAGNPGDYCLPNDQLDYVLYTDDCNSDGTTGDWGDYDYLVRADFTYDDEVTPVFTDVTGTMPRGSHPAWGDFDADGDDDLLLDASLWRNDGAAGFADVTATAFAGLGNAGGSGLWGDYDNDGHLDVFVSAHAADRLWRNRGDGTFEDASAAAGPISDTLPTEAGGWADYDNDGRLDFYKANYEDWNNGNPIYFPDVLLHGEAGGTFTDATASSGIGAIEAAEGAAQNGNTGLAGRGVNWGDFDADGCIDLHLSNYRLCPNLLLKNGCNGTFTDVGAATGVRGTERSGAYAGAYGHTIGSQWADCDNDGDLDLLQARLRHQWGWCFQDPTFLWRNEGPGLPFTETHDAAHVEYQETHSDVSWGDVDNDGDLDFYLSAVYECQPADLYLNQGDATFRNVTYASKLFNYGAWGTAMADFDGDGDLDLFNRGLWRNDGPVAGSWLKVRLDGSWANGAAIGARVSVTAGGRTMLREVEGGKGTSTQSSLTQHFGLGAAATIDAVDIRWPSQCTPTRITGVPVGVTLSVTEPCTTLLRGTDPRTLTAFLPWDPSIDARLTDSDVLPSPLRCYAIEHDLRIYVAKTAAGDAVISADPFLTWSW